jgi:uncharacterized protein YbbK (DUF523 family)
MSSDEYRNEQQNGSPSAGQETEQESDDWGVGWMQSCRRTRDDEPIGNARSPIAEQTPSCGSAACYDGNDKAPGEPAAWPES